MKEAGNIEPEWTMCSTSIVDITVSSLWCLSILVGAIEPGRLMELLKQLENTDWPNVPGRSSGKPFEENYRSASKKSCKLSGVSGRGSSSGKNPSRIFLILIACLPWRKQSQELIRLITQVEVTEVVGNSSVAELRYG